MTIPTPPSPGQPVSATFFSRLVGFIRSCMLVDGPGYRVRRNPNGTALEIDLPAAARPAAAADLGCFAIGMEVDPSDPDPESKPVPAFIRRYYQVGGRTYEAPFASASDPYYLFDESFAALLVEARPGSGGNPVASVVWYNEFAELAAAQQNLECVVVPLWKFSKGVPVCDLRTIPNVQAWEFFG